MKKVTYIILILTMMSCKSASITNQGITSNKYIEILSGNHSNFNNQSFKIIKSKKELQKIYATLNKTRTPKHKIPKINFSKEVVVGLFMGSKNSGGYSIKIDYIKSDDKFTAIFVKEIKPKGMATSVITQPFYLAKITKPITPIRFITFQ